MTLTDKPINTVHATIVNQTLELCTKLLSNHVSVETDWNVRCFDRKGLCQKINIRYSSLILLLTTCHLSHDWTLPPLLWRHGCCIFGPIISLFSIVTDEDLCGWNVLHFNLFATWLLNNCPAPTYAIKMSLYQTMRKCSHTSSLPFIPLLPPL